MAAVSDTLNSKLNFRARPFPKPWFCRIERRQICSALLVLITFGVSVSVGAADLPSPPQRESAVKAAFLYKFSGFAEWPPTSFKSPGENFVIGVYGDDEIAADLEKLVVGRTVEGRPIVARRIRELGPDMGAHILFIGRQQGNRLRDALAASAGPVLVVTDQEGTLGLGSVINFSTEGGRIRFAVSLPSAEARSIKLSARLLAVAQYVEGRTR
jgi:hypothetical protein